MEASTVNGRKIADYRDISVRETGLAVVEAQPLYVPQVSNGYHPDDIVVDASLVLNMPLYRLLGSSIPSVDRYGHIGTIIGALWRPDGRFFDGINDQIRVAASLAFEATTAVTFEMWVNPDVAVPDQNQLGIALNNHPVQSRRLELWVRRNNAAANRIALFNAVGGGVISSASVAPPGQFSHIVLVYPASALYVVYLNAVVDRTAASQAMPAWIAGTTSVMIGNNANVLPFNGIEGEARVYVRALSPEEVAQNFNATRWRYQ